MAKSQSAGLLTSNFAVRPAEGWLSLGKHLHVENPMGTAQEESSTLW